MCFICLVPNKLRAKHKKTPKCLVGIINIIIFAYAYILHVTEIMEAISHLYRDSYDCWHIQSNEDHLAGVAKLAESFASEFGMGNGGRVLGLFFEK